MFHQTDIFATQHLQKVGDELGKHGNKEKTGFIQKEAEFVKLLKEVQTKHLDTCIMLMKMGIFVMFIEFVFSVFSIIKFECLGDCENTLICCIHYIKLCQSLFLINTYKSYIKERQHNHPIGTLNTFLVVLLYYVSLYWYMGDLKETTWMVHACAVYPLLDLIMIIISFFAIHQVRAEKFKLFRNEKFKEYRQEAALALSDILYLPQEFQSDDGEEEF